MNETVEAGTREKLTENFYRDEFACKCGCGEDRIDMKLVIKLQKVRDEFGRSLKVTSGCRCPAHNKRIKGSRFSAHTFNVAADIYCADSSARWVLLKLLQNEFKRIGVYTEWFHVDIDVTKPQEVLW